MCFRLGPLRGVAVSPCGLEVAEKFVTESLRATNLVEEDAGQRGSAPSVRVAVLVATAPESNSSRNVSQAP